MDCFELFRPLLEVLLTALSLFAMGWWPCGGCATCPECENCTYETPCEIEVLVQGFEDNGYCPDCESLNATYVLAYRFQPCHWEYTFPDELCGAELIELSLFFPTSPNNYVQIRDAIGTQLAIGVGDFSHDCASWDQEPLPTLVLKNDECQGTVTAHVTAII